MSLFPVVIGVTVTCWHFLRTRSDRRFAVGIVMIISHTVADVSTSDFDGHTATGKFMDEHFLWVWCGRKLFFFRSKITVILTSDSFGCELQLWALDDDLWLLPVLSVISKCRNTVVHIPAYSYYHCQTLIFKKTWCVKFISMLHRRSLLVVAKSVSWTLVPDRPRKTGSRYNDTPSCIGKPKGSVTMASMSQKVTVLFDSLLDDFFAKTALGVFYPPLRCRVPVLGAGKSNWGCWPAPSSIGALQGGHCARWARAMAHPKFSLGGPQRIWPVCSLILKRIIIGATNEEGKRGKET